MYKIAYWLARSDIRYTSTITSSSVLVHESESVGDCLLRISKELEEAGYTTKIMDASHA